MYVCTKKRKKSFLSRAHKWYPTEPVKGSVGVIFSPPRKKAPERLPFCVVRDKAVNAARTVFADKREGRAGSREGVARRFAERTPLGFRQIPAISTIP